MSNQLHEIKYKREYINTDTSYLLLLKLEQKKCCKNCVKAAYTGIIL